MMNMSEITKQKVKERKKKKSYRSTLGISSAYVNGSAFQWGAFFFLCVCVCVNCDRSWRVTLDYDFSFLWCVQYSRIGVREVEKRTFFFNCSLRVSGKTDLISATYKPNPYHLFFPLASSCFFFVFCFMHDNSTPFPVKHTAIDLHQASFFSVLFLCLFF